MNHVFAGFAAFILMAAGGALVIGASVEPAGGDSGLTTASASAARLPSLSAADVANGIDAPPTWRVGDAWQLLFAGGRVPCVAVVVSADEDGYQQAFRCPEGSILAVQDARYDIAHLGAFTHELEGEYDGDSVRFFDWPLTDGKTWELDVYGNEYEVTATFLPEIEGPFGPEPGYMMLAEFEGGSEPQFAYNYVPSVGWWTMFETPDGDFSFAVVGFERDWHGSAWTASANTRMDQRSTAVPPAGSAFEVSEDDDFVIVAGTTAGMHRADIELTDGDGNDVYSETLDGTTSFGFVEFGTEVPATPGRWELSLEGVGSQSWRVRVITLDLRTWHI